MTKSYSKGFTLIELVMVILILGILSASAVPKFFSMRGDARIASLRSLKGAFKTTNQMAYSKALIKGTNMGYDEDGGEWDKNCTENQCVEINGIWVHLKNSYIDRCDIAFAVDSDINGNDSKSTRVHNGKTIAKDFVTECNKFKGQSCDHDYCQCFLQNSRGTTQVFLARGISYDSITGVKETDGKYTINQNTCALTYQSAANKIGKKPVYNFYFDDC